MNKKRKQELTAVAIYLIAAVGMGYLSQYLADVTTSFMIAIAGLFIIAKLLKSILKSDEKFVWFISNGGMIYIFTWIVIWTILTNL